MLLLKFYTKAVQKSIDEWLKINYIFFSSMNKTC
jgi:hypothetical protein